MTWLWIAVVWVGLIPALFVLSARRVRAGLNGRKVARRREAADPRVRGRAAG